LFFHGYPLPLTLTLTLSHRGERELNNLPVHLIIIEKNSKKFLTKIELLLIWVRELSNQLADSNA